MQSLNNVPIITEYFTIFGSLVAELMSHLAIGTEVGVSNTNAMQKVRTTIISKAVCRCFLIMSLWLPRDTTVSSTKKNSAEVKFELVTSYGTSYLYVRPLYQHNKVGIAGSKLKARVKIRHLLLFFYYVFK